MDEHKRAVFTAICEAMQSGMSLRQACEVAKVSKSTILHWVDQSAKGVEDYAGLLDQYTHARDIMTDNYADDIHELADVTDINKPMIEPADRRTAIDAKKWLLSKLLPKKYGDIHQLKQIDDKGNAVTPVINLVLANNKKDDE